MFLVKGFGCYHTGGENLVIVFDGEEGKYFRKITNSDTLWIVGFHLYLAS